MPRTRRAPGTQSAPAAVPSSLLEMLNKYADPVVLAEYIDEDDPRDNSPNNQAYSELRTRFLSGYENTSELHALYKLVLDNVDNFSLIERAIRLSGFVVGFTVAARLLTGQAPAGGGRQ